MFNFRLVRFEIYVTCVNECPTFKFGFWRNWVETNILVNIWYFHSWPEQDCQGSECRQRRELSARTLAYLEKARGVGRGHDQGAAGEGGRCKSKGTSCHLL